MNDKKLMDLAADNIRILAASMVEKAKSGHPGGAMGGADFINVLFSEFLIYDPKDPSWTVATAFSSTLDTCRLCFIRPWLCKESLLLTSFNNFASGVRPLLVIPKGT